jgi:hypothetical protein
MIFAFWPIGVLIAVVALFCTFVVWREERDEKSSDPVYCVATPTADTSATWTRYCVLCPRCYAEFEMVQVPGMPWDLRCPVCHDAVPRSAAERYSRRNIKT